MSRRWYYLEQGDDGEPLERSITEDEILRDFYPWWRQNMEALGRHISPEHCIEDFVVVNWASSTPIKKAQG